MVSCKDILNVVWEIAEKTGHRLKLTSYMFSRGDINESRKRERSRSDPLESALSEQDNLSSLEHRPPTAQDDA